MKLILTFTNDKESMDFQLKSEIQIYEALAIIRNNVNFSVNENILYIYSRNKQERISVNLSFEQAEIYSGDELIIEGGIK